jgi:hypothetical protein
MSRADSYVFVPSTLSSLNTVTATEAATYFTAATPAGPVTSAAAALRMPAKLGRWSTAAERSLVVLVCVAGLGPRQTLMGNDTATWRLPCRTDFV